MFSVIVPVYNKSAYIEKCLNSVFSQTYQDFEIIVVNDGSTDDSFERAKIFSNPKLQFIDQANLGVSIARNNGVKAARYNFIAFLDADDWWEPTYLEEMKSLIEDYPDAGIYGSRYFTVKNGRKHKETIYIEPNFTRGIINYCRVYAKTLSMPLWTGATIIHKSIFESQNGFKPELKFGEDFDLWIRVALKYDVVFLNEPLANYNQDVELKNRAIGNLHKPEHHMLWNLEFLSGEEQTNADLKQLLDNLRVYSLLPYYLNNESRELAKKELDKVDWTKQPVSAKLRYDTPVIILKAINHFKYFGSKIKQSSILEFSHKGFIQ